MFRVQRYDVQSGHIDHDYAFAVQPLMQQIRGYQYLVQGQYQLPLYEGKAPTDLLLGKHPAQLLLRSLINQKRVRALDYVQLIARTGLVGGANE